MSKVHNQEIAESKFGSLIEQLGPLNNRWRDGEPAKKVLTLWSMGEVLLDSTLDPSDSFLWEIQKRSYITRNLLRYALIIRRSWASQSILEELVQGLKNYTVFREALPFLKGSREGIDEKTYGKVVAFLRDPNTRNAIQYLKELKSQRIGRQHKKGASIAAIRDQATSFSQALAHLESDALTNLKTKVTAPDELLIALSRATMSIATDEGVEKLPTVTIKNNSLSALAASLEAVIRGGRTTAAAFRKVVGAERLMQAADLLNSYRSEDALTEWRRRHGAKISFEAQKNMEGGIDERDSKGIR